MQVQRWTTEKRLASNSVYGQGLKYAGLKEVDKVLIPIHNIAKNHWVRNSGCPTGDCANSMLLAGNRALWELSLPGHNSPSCCNPSHLTCLQSLAIANFRDKCVEFYCTLHRGEKVEEVVEDIAHIERWVTQDIQDKYGEGQATGCYDVRIPYAIQSMHISSIPATDLCSCITSHSAPLDPAHG
jgi:hypothetical protein